MEHIKILLNTILSASLGGISITSIIGYAITSKFFSHKKVLRKILRACIIASGLLIFWNLVINK